MKLSLWSFITGLLWGVSSGVGLMLWVLLKLLRFQRKDLERRHAWLRWGLKYRNMRPQSLEDIAREWEWDKLDEEFRMLLAAVNADLQGRGALPMSQPELSVAIRSLIDHREEGNARFAIQQAVNAVSLYRRSLEGGPSSGVGSFTAGSMGGTHALTRPS